MSKKIKNPKIKISVLDVVILVVVLAVAAALIFRFTADTQLFKYETEKYTVTFKSQGIRYTSIDMISSNSSYFTEDGELFGVSMRAPTVTPTLDYFVSSSGELVASYYPDNTLVDIIVEIEAELVLKDGALMTKNGVHIARGSILEVHTNAVDLEVEIVNVEKQIIE